MPRVKERRGTRVFFRDLTSTRVIHCAYRHTPSRGEILRYYAAKAPSPQPADDREKENVFADSLPLGHNFSFNLDTEYFSNILSSTRADETGDDSDSGSLTPTPSPREFVEMLQPDPSSPIPNEEDKEPHLLNKRLKKFKDLADSLHEWEDESMKKNKLVKSRFANVKAPVVAAKLYKRKSLKTQTIRRCLFTPMDLQNDLKAREQSDEEEGGKKPRQRDSLPKKGLVEARAAFFERQMQRRESIRPPRRSCLLLKQKSGPARTGGEPPKTPPKLFDGGMERIKPKAAVSPMIKKIIDNLFEKTKGPADKD